ncbi:hypothetical protein QR680_008085 [Steinernema hermaphroditum]|uniref:RNase NYN domain-containing protein n=1 Tax=Steinernema hermaphroditum TaxID=289476 RepID=A0AA39M715_9BILA|nr:hypothetical protein QR680_008085 [Steinernema hermaphroditum]
MEAIESAEAVEVDPAYEATMRDCVLAYAGQIAQNLSDVREEDIVLQFMELLGIEELEWYKTRMEYECFAVRFGFTREEFLYCMQKADDEGVDVDADWLLEQLCDAFGENMRDRTRLESQETHRLLEFNFQLGLRSVIIDGLNVARSCGTKRSVNMKALKTCVDYFTERGHHDVLIVLPSYYKVLPTFGAGGCRIVGKEILQKLNEAGRIFWSPAHKIHDHLFVPYDDRYILKLAQDKDGVIVSNDTYRDLQLEDINSVNFIEERVLMYAFVRDRFILPEFQLGNNGPHVSSLLHKERLPSGVKCPFGQRCTYGKECKFDHGCANIV